MLSALEDLPIRRRIVLLVVTVLVPVAAMFGWALMVDLQRSGESANASVTAASDHVAGELGRTLRRTEEMFARLAERPLVRAMDARRCDPLIADAIRLEPEFSMIWLRDLRGQIVCASVADPMPSVQGMPWFDEALKRGRFGASDAFVRKRTGRWVSVLTHPVHDDTGAQVGLLSLPVDLLSLSEQLLAATPAHAIVTVVDRSGAVVLQSVRPEAVIGTRPAAADADPARARRDGTVSATGPDGVRRLVAMRTVPGADWRVSASLPESQLYADFHARLQRTLGVGVGVLLLALWLAWRLGSAIVRPITDLAATAARVAAGGSAVRAVVGGPAEVGMVAQQFNRMLDARDASEAARREADARYRTLVDWSPEALSVHVDGRVRFVNQACLDLLGAASADELVGKSSGDVVPADRRQVAQAVVQEAIGQGRPVAPQEQTFVRLDGSPVEVTVQGIPIVFDGEPALLASMRDITQRKRTEVALAKSESLLRGIVDSATVAIITADDAQRIVSANPAAAAMFRYDAADLVGKPLERLIPMRYRESHRREMQAFGDRVDAPRHMGAQRDVVGVRADGAEFPIDAAISQLNVGGERLFTVILRDVSERLAAEQALRRSEASLRRLLVVLPEAVFVSTGERVSFVNEAAQRLFGTDAAALLGRPPLSLIHPDSVELVRQRIEKVRGGSEFMPAVEVKVLRPDGSVRVVESTAVLVADHDQESILVVLRDVTELNETRRALANSHGELQRLVAAQDRVQEDERKRIARELHDDLQQTLAAIRIDLVAAGQRLQTAPQTVAPLLDETSELAASAIDSARRIINDLRPQMLEDLGLVSALESLAGQFSRRTGVDCRIREHDAIGREVPLPPVVATTLYRVAQEALGNIAKHARASKAWIVFKRAADGRVSLRISDNGKGMVMGEPRKPESFGLLGMQERVRTLGGTLRVGSEPGSGTTIEVHVPGAHAPDGARPGADDGPH
jgi:PAS domain S-box-containing protein